VERDDFNGIVYVSYTSITEPDARFPLQIVLARAYSDPEPLLLRDASVATAANFLPVPGVALRDVTNHTAMWPEAAGRYTILIDQQYTSISLEEVAALLEPFTPPRPQAPPATGSGAMRPANPVSTLTALGVLLASGGAVLVASPWRGPFVKSWNQSGPRLSPRSLPRT
jgi:hypothetical protein